MLKKSGLNKEISKIIDLSLTCRSYRKFWKKHHSTEATLLRVHHDIAVTLDNNSCAVLVMLGLSTAFDVLDHDILHKRLEHTFGITNNALSWIKSYMSEKTQRISIGSEISNPVPLDIGVPQGSVLVQKIYCIFPRSLTDIWLHHGMQYHVFADDTQVYLIVKPTRN